MKKRADGRYQQSVYIGTDNNGKQKYRVVYGNTKKIVRAHVSSPPSLPAGICKGREQSCFCPRALPCTAPVCGSFGNTAVRPHPGIPALRVLSA